jgi:hypothetical protein
MIIAIDSISEIKSRHNNRPVIRLDGHYADEFNALQKCYTFVDPENDNFADWEAVLRVIAENRGNIVELDGCRFKNRDKGLISADCRPRVEAIYPKPEKPKISSHIKDPFNRLFGPKE